MGLETRDVKFSRPGLPRGQILWPQPRSWPHSCWPRPHELWSYSFASWPCDLDNSQVDGKYELSTSFSVLSLNSQDFWYLLTSSLCDVYFCIFENCDKLNILQIFVWHIN